MGSSRSVSIHSYIEKLFAVEDADLFEIKKSVKDNKLPPIEISASVGKLLSLMIQIQRPKRILEIGTLAGYSTLWMARNMDLSCHLITLEVDQKNISVARKNLEKANVLDRVEIREGRAQDLLEEMIKQNEEPFDFIFLDADKRNYPSYLDLLLKLSRNGTLILSDNLIPKGNKIMQFESPDFDLKDVYLYNDRLSKHPNLETILIPTLVKGGERLDGIGLSIVKKSKSP